MTSAAGSLARWSLRSVGRRDVLLSAVALAVSSAARGAGALTLYGSSPTIMLSLAREWQRNFNRRNGALRIEIAPTSGPPQGALNPAFEQFLKGHADFAFLTREISEADLATFNAAYRADPVIIPVAGGAWNRFGYVDAVVIIVNATNPIRRLSFRQIDAIFSASHLRGGSASNWGDVGVAAWRHRPIHAVGGNAWNGVESARALTIRRRILSYKGVRGRWRAAPGSGDDADVVDRVAADPLAIGFTGLGHLAAGVRMVAVGVPDGAALPTRETIATGSYPLARTIDLLLPPPSRSAAAIGMARFARYLTSPAGQRIVAKATSFVRLNDRQLVDSRRMIERYEAAA